MFNSIKIMEKFDNYLDFYLKKTWRIPLGYRGGGITLFDFL